MGRSWNSAAASAVSGKSITLAKKATKTGKLYAAITEQLIADTLRDQHSIEIDEASISIPEQIKAIGEFTANVEVGGLKEDLTVVISEEK